MKTFATFDFLVVAAYVLGIAILGSSFYRRRSTARQYFLGDRSMSWLPVGISIVAADTSAITVMGLPAWGYKHNLEFAWLSLGYLLMAPVVIFVFIPFYSRLKLYTAYEYLERRFNLPVRLIASITFQFLRGAHVAIAIYAPSLVINLITGLPTWECILIMGGVTTIYTTFGGMKAVIWTDVIQFTVMVSGLVLIFAIALLRIDGGPVAAYQTALRAGHLKLFNFSTDPRELTSLWACLAGGCVLTLSVVATDQALLQRLFTTRSAKDSTRSIILNALINSPLVLFLLALGAVLAVFYQHYPGRLAGLNSEDAILPLFAVRELPVGISGLVIAAIFAASMAVMSAGINALATATTVDFYQRLFRPQASQEQCASLGRISTLAWGSVATVLALYAGHLGDLAMAYNRISSVLAGPMLGIFLLGLLSRRVSATGSLVGGAAGIIAVSLVMSQTPWSFLYLSPIGLIVTLLAGYATTFLMQPPTLEKVRGMVMGMAVGEPEVSGKLLT